MENYKKKYNPPDYTQITCKSFGYIDGMNASCHYCLMETPYQWEMCSDESWKKGLMSPHSKIPNCSESEAIQFINDYKSKHF